MQADAQRAFDELGRALAGFAHPADPLAQALGFFGQAGERLAQALSSFPSTLKIQSGQRVEVSINGTEALARLHPAMGAYVEGLINEQRNNVFRGHFPEAGVNLE